MSEAIELAIRDLLLAEGNSDRVAKSLLKRLAEDSPSRKERTVFIHFLIHAGYTHEVLELYAEWFKKSFPVPLTPFCFILHNSGFHPGDEFIRQIFEVQELSVNDNKISSFLPWEDRHPQFKELKEKLVQNLLDEKLQKKNRQFEKLEYLRLNRMIDEEEKLLDELIKNYPEETQLITDKKNFKQRWARAIIAEKSLESLDILADEIAPTFTEQEKQAGKILTKAMLEIAKRKPEMSYNLAIGLYFLDMYPEALQVLKNATANLQSDWLLIELLLRSRRFVECLDSCYHIENRYAADPETVFGTTYYRAQALHGLGQSTTAKDLLRSLVTIRPSYRSAHSLLLKWGG